MIKAVDINLAFERSKKLDSLIDPEIFNIYASVGKMQKCFMNNLAHAFKDDLRHLEIGTARGCSFVSTLNKTNPKYCCTMDPWDTSKGSADHTEEFKALAERFLPSIQYNFLRKDCFAIDPKTEIKSKINFFFYDAEHSIEAQKKAFIHYNDIFDDEFLALVDDYNDPKARQGTEEAFKELEYESVQGLILPTEYWDKEGGGGNSETFWNGLGVFLIKK